MGCQEVRRQHSAAHQEAHGHDEKEMSREGQCKVRSCSGGRRVQGQIEGQDQEEGRFDDGRREESDRRQVQRCRGETKPGRQLRDRRGLAASADVETTWDNNAPSNVGDDVNVDLGADFDPAVPTMSSQPTGGSIQGTQPVAPIDDTLPNVPDDSTTAMATTTAVDIGDRADSGASGVTFGAAAAAVCATLWFF